MSETANLDLKCERCGTALTADAPEGLCPRCLMALNLGGQTDVFAAEAGPADTQVVPPRREPAPPLEEIARQFPQLEILECLGRGGMGVVYKARQPRLNRFVALKILTREKERDPRFAERFSREAQALARLNHPNIVTIYDFGETNGLYYLLMEFVDGKSLRQLLQIRKLAPEEALTIVPSICEALQYAHQQGIVHRDIKPENILHDKQGRLKIADFGIAMLLGAEGEVQSLTSEHQVVGTPHYMAPEQAEKPYIVDHRADIYSLGVVFYEMLTGELPLGKFAPPSSMVKLDVRLDEVVLRALEKEPARRYQQVSQVKTDVELIAMTEGGGATSAAGQDWLVAGVGAASGMENVWRQVTTWKVAAVITAAVLLVLAIPVGAILLVMRVPAYQRAQQRASSGPQQIGQPAPTSQALEESVSRGSEAWQRGDYREALKLLMPAARKGNRIAQHRIGVMYVMGDGVEQDSAEASRWLRKAAEQGHGEAQFSMGLRYLEGQGVAQNDAEAARWLRLAAEQGVGKAASVLAELYAKGRGVPQDLVEAYQWLLMAGDQIEPNRVTVTLSDLADKLTPEQLTEAQGRVKEFVPRPTPAAAVLDPQELDSAVRRGWGYWTNRDYSEALKLLLPAAQQGHAVAQHRVGIVYALGQGVEQDLAEATHWFRAAAEQGQGESQFSLGLRYQLGQSVAQDDKEAAHWYKLAAEQGIAMAAAILARQYAEGEGVPRDLVEAYKWAALASKLPSPTNGGVTTADLESQLTPDQLAEAQRRVKEFVPKRTGPADP